MKWEEWRDTCQAGGYWFGECPEQFSDEVNKLTVLLKMADVTQAVMGYTARVYKGSAGIKKSVRPWRLIWRGDDGYPNWGYYETVGGLEKRIKQIVTAKLTVAK